MDSSGKKYKPYKYAFKTELSKAPPVLPKAPKSPGKPDKKLHPGFQMSFAKCNECGKPRVVYSKLKLGINGVLYFQIKSSQIFSPKTNSIVGLTFHLFSRRGNELQPK